MKFKWVSKKEQMQSKQIKKTCKHYKDKCTIYSKEAYERITCARCPFYNKK